jgi:hypothetical protein
MLQRIFKSMDHGVPFFGCLHRVKNRISLKKQNRQWRLSRSTTIITSFALAILLSAGQPLLEFFDKFNDRSSSPQPHCIAHHFCFWYFFGACFNHNQLF